MKYLNFKRYYWMDTWYKIWYFYYNLILKSFKVTDYTKNFDLSVDNFFHIFKKLKNEGIMENDKEVNYEKIDNLESEEKR